VFNGARMVAEYVERYYLPAHAAGSAGAAADEVRAAR
jgi:hypothetical protein